jgi:hypothetical protein
MNPPSDFLIDSTKEYGVSTQRYVKPYQPSETATLSELRDDTIWPLNRTYVWINERMYLRESIWLKAIDRKEVLEKIMRENEKVTCLCHFKFKGIVRDVLNQAAQIKWSDRKNRPLTQTVYDDQVVPDYAARLNNILAENECFVFEYSENIVPNFLYNTTKAVRLGEPTWLR